MSKKLWKNWTKETRAVVNQYASWFFAALLLNALLLANVGLILFIVSQVKSLVGKL